MMIHRIVFAPQPLIRRDSNKDSPPRTQEAMGLPEDFKIIIHMLDDVEKSDEIESDVRIGEGVQRTLMGVFQAALAAQLDGNRGSIRAVRFMLS